MSSRKNKAQFLMAIMIFTILMATFPIPITVVKADGVPLPDPPQTPQVYQQIRYFTDWFAVQPIFLYNNYDEVSYDGLVTEKTPFGNYQYYTADYNIPTKYGVLPLHYLQSSPRIVDEKVVGQFTTEDGKQIFIKAFTVEWDQCLYSMANGKTYFGDSIYNDRNVELCRLTLSTNVNPTAYVVAAILTILGVPSTSQVAQFWEWMKLHGCATAVLSSTITFPEYYLGGYTTTDKQIQHYDNVSLNKTYDGMLFSRVWATSAGWTDLFNNVKLSTGEYDYQNNTWVAIRGTIVKNWQRGLIESGLNTIINKFETSYEPSPVIGSPSYSQINTDPTGNKYPDSRATYVSVHGYYEGAIAYNGTNEGDYRQWGAYIYNDPINALLPTWTVPENTNDTRYNLTYWGEKNYSAAMHEYDMSQVLVGQHYTLQAQTRLFLTHQKYHYEAAGEFYAYNGISLNIRPSGFAAEERVDTTVSGWEVKNVYSLTTMQTQVMVGAYYNWTPYTGIGGTMEPPNATTTDNIFSAIPSGAYEALQESPQIPGTEGIDWTTIIIIIIGIIIAIIVGYGLFRYMRRKRRGIVT